MAYSLYKICLLLFFVSFVFDVSAQCIGSGGQSVDLPDANQPIINPSNMYCVSFDINPAVTGHPIGIFMDLMHTFIGDLTIRVQACGNTLMVMTRPGGGSCNAGGPFGHNTQVNGEYLFGDGLGPNPDLGLNPAGGTYGLSGDPCGVNTVNSFAALAAACGAMPYTFSICITDHAFAFAGFAQNIQPVFPGQGICGCTDPEAPNYDPGATIDDGSCLGAPCDLTVMTEEIQPENCGQSDGRVVVSASGGSGIYQFTWNTVPVQTTSLAEMLPAGMYTVTVNDSNNPTCTATIQVTIPSAIDPQIALLPAAPNCLGNNGNIIANINGGSGSFSLLWSHDSQLQQPFANNLGSGNYSLIVTDLETGCTVSSSVVLEPPVPIETDYFVVQPDCNNPGGFIQITTSGGTGLYQYNWSHDPSLNQNIGSDLPPGTYEITISDAGNLCEEVLIIEIEEPITFEISYEAFETTCGLSNGGFFIEITGGIGPFQAGWSGPTSGNGLIADQIPGGWYFVQVLDLSSNCLLEIELEVPESEALFANATVESTSCGSNNGSIAIFVANGSGSFEYNWISHGQYSGSEVSGLEAGMYEIEVQDMMTGCILELEFIIEPSEVVLVTADILPSDCGENNGQISLSVENGSGSYLYSWSHSAVNSGNINNLSGGEYTVTITDLSFNCEVIETFTVPSSEPFDADLEVQNPSCGLSNGSITVIPLSGSGNYSYSWSHNPLLDGAIASDLSGGINYQVLITDLANGCNFILSVNLPQSSAITIQTNITPLRCAPDDASISVIPQNGSGDYTFDWEAFPGMNVSMLENVEAGNYILNIMDNVIGCTGIFEIIIFPLDVLEISCNVIQNETGSGASDGILGVRSSGGTGLHNIAIIRSGNPVPVFAAQGMAPFINTVNNLAPGTYNILVTDASGCTASCQLSILPGDCNLSAAVSESVDPDCHNGSNGRISITTMGGTAPLSVIWENNGVIASDVLSVENLAAGIYEINITDALGCQSSLSIELNNPHPISLICTPAHESAPDLGDGSVSFVVQNILYPITIELTGPVTNTLVFADSDELKMENLIPGVYMVLLTASNGCSSTCSFTINSSNCVLAASIQSVTHMSCFDAMDGMIQINLIDAVGNVDITWGGLGGSLENLLISDLGPGIYTINIQDELGCLVTLQTELNTPDPLEILTDIQPTDCQVSNGSAIIHISGGTVPYVVSWPDGMKTSNRNDLAFGSYKLTITDAGSCEEIINIEIGSKDSPEISLISKNNIDCFSAETGFIEISTSVPPNTLRIQWSHGPLDLLRVENLGAGIYTVSATDINGCTGILNIEIEENDAITISAEVRNPECGSDDGSITLLVEGGVGPYRVIEPFITGQLQFIDLAPGVYNYVVADDLGCTASVQVVLSGSGEPDVLAGEDLSLTCRDSSFLIGTHLSSLKDFYDFKWYFNDLSTAVLPGDEIITITEAGIYILEAIDKATGCFSLDTLTVDNKVTPFTNIEREFDPPSCFGDADGFIKITNIVGGTGPFVFSINGQTQQSLEAFQLPAGNYFLQMEDVTGCQWEEHISLPNPERLHVSLPSSHTIRSGESIDIIASLNFSASDIQNIVWMGDSSGLICNACPASSLSDFQIYQNQTIHLEITTLAGCVVSASTIINVLIQKNIFIPQAFSPDANNINDVFFIYGNDQLKEIVHMEIFDRWGNQLFSKNNLLPHQENEGWDGRYKNLKMQPGIYAYSFLLEFVDGTRAVYAGEVVLIN